MRGVRRGSFCRLTSQVSERPPFCAIYLFMRTVCVRGSFSLSSARQVWEILDASRLASRKSSLYSALSAAGMALFVDRYRPKTLDDLDYHPELSSRLRALVSSPLRPSSLSAPALLTSGV